MASISPVGSESFTPEQKEYLSGFFVGAMQRFASPFVGVAPSGHITSDPASGVANLAAEAERYHGTPLSDLSREERWKFEQNPLDIWDKLLQHAGENRAPQTEDVFRFKFHGLFYVAPAQDSFMLRLRIAGGKLTAYQMRGLADMAEAWGSGRADLTTRANIQIREFQPKDIVRVLNKVHSLGLSSRGSGADNIRNITASPATGLDPTELLDVAPYAEALHYYILNSRDLYELPRKFNVAFDSGGTISVVADTNDIGFQAVRVGEGRSVPPGVYFRVVLCGITGHKQFASDSGIVVTPEQSVAVAAAMIRVFIELGDRTDRKKARLKYLIDRWGVEKFIAETKKRLAFPLLRCAPEECEPRNPIDRAGHIGVHPQRQPGMNYIGVSIPVGRLPVEQMRALAAIADEFGDGEMRLTVWQNLLIPNIHDSRVGDAIQRLRVAGLDCTAGAVLRGTVACTGNRGCRYAATDTKAHAVEIANLLDARFNKFRLPANPDTAMIMIGPGTGIAPFRGFLHERRALGHKGRNWLFFGERSAATDFFYREEFEAMLADGHLARLDTAFSRDQEDKVYVQDRMMQNSQLLWDWLQQGANVYVCGDASHMGKDVHATLRKIAEKEGGMSPQGAEEYVTALKEQHRYHRDLY